MLKCKLYLRYKKTPALFPFKYSVFPFDISLILHRVSSIRPSRAKPHLHSLDAPTRRLDNWLRCYTLCFRSSMPRCSLVRKPVWMQLHSPCMRAEAWQAIQGVSEWVMATVRRGYTLQLARRPPHFRGVLTTTARREDAQVLEEMNLLEKGAIEIVPPAQSESGFYSRYFLVPKKDGGL